MNNLVKSAKAGSIVPIVEELPHAVNPVEYFEKLSDYGNKKNSLMFESADIVPKYGEKSLGSSDPCLKVFGKNENFEITALNRLGERFICFLKNDFDFCDEAIYLRKSIKGKLKPKRSSVSEEERLKLPNHMDIIRKVAFKFRPTIKPFIPYAGLFGCISYDFIAQFEDLPENRQDIMKEPDYALYFLDNMFLIDHKSSRTFLIANALITNDGQDEYDECMLKIEKYRKAINGNIFGGEKNPKNISKKQKIESDTSKEEFAETVKKIKGHIMAGDVYQAVLSRTLSMDIDKKPLDIYKKLIVLNQALVH